MRSTHARPHVYVYAHARPHVYVYAHAHAHVFICILHVFTLKKITFLVELDDSMLLRNTLVRKHEVLPFPLPHMTSIFPARVRRGEDAGVLDIVWSILRES